LSDPGLVKKTLKILQTYQIRPSKNMGQSYVVDPELIFCIIGAAKLERGETVLEIGAGTGNLTAEIAEIAGKVIAVEKDSKTAEALRNRFLNRSNVEIVTDDVLLMDLPKVDKIISNLPYSISTPLTFKILFEGRFSLAALTYQKEVADRLLAEPGEREYSRLSVAASLLAEIKRIKDFPPESFFPVPAVESTVVVLRKKAEAAGTDWKCLDEALKFLFSQRRRTLRKALETYSKVRHVELSCLLEGAGEDMIKTRVCELRPEEFVRISLLFKDRTKAEKDR